jgi:hypothetical protein
MPISAHAQTAGAPCATAGQFHESGTESLVCDSSVWKPVISYAPDGTIGFQVGNDTGTCTAVKTGRLRYSSNLWEYCNGSAWTNMQQIYKDCNISGKSAGYVCPDGSVFAGFSQGSSYVPIFTTRCEAGRTWNGTACSGTATQFTWGSSGVARGTSNLTNGQADTALLASFGATAHPAAAYCDSLTMHGHSDWYLPSPVEAENYYTFNAAIGNWTQAYYLTSMESVFNPQTHVVTVRANPDDGHLDTQAKTITTFYVRCMRRL